MKRRSFLGLLGGAVAAPVTSATTKAEEAVSNPAFGYRHDQRIDDFFAQAPMRLAMVDKDGWLRFVSADGKPLNG